MSERIEPIVGCDMCGQAYTLPEEESAGNLPHVLLCGHIFCTTCLRSLDFEDAILCPDCKVESELSDYGVDGLQVDSRIVGLIYTTKMNMKKNRSAKRRKRCRSASSVVSIQERPELGPNTEKVLDNALLQAAENLSRLNDIHQAQVEVFQVQMKREKSRILKEIDEAVDKASSLLQKRKGVLVAELQHMEKHFSASKQQLEESVKILETAMQKAKQVKQFPSLGSYCDTEKLLEILQAPVDAQFTDPVHPALSSGLSCSLQVEELTESLKRCLELTVGNPKSLGVEESASVMPRPQPDRNGCATAPVDTECGKQHPSDREPGFPPRDLVQESLGIRPVCASWFRPAPDGPNVIIEEVMEESDCAVPPPPSPPTPEAKASDKCQRAQMRHKKGSVGNPQIAQAKVFQEWVIVTHVVNPNHFYIRHVGESKAGVLLTRKINAHCSGERGLFTSGDVLETGSMVFVKWKENTWCRTTLTEVHQRGCDRPVSKCQAPLVSGLRAFFQDYGFSKEVSLETGADPELVLFNLNQCVRRPDLANEAELSRWVPQAVKCSLKDITPTDLVKGWRAEAQAEFLRVVGTRVVEMQVFGQEGDTLLVDLKKGTMDNSSSDMPVSLREYLVFLELAKFYSPVAWKAKTVSYSRMLQFHPPVFPRAMEELYAVVCHINTPSDFYIQLVDNTEFLPLNHKLQECYSQNGSGGQGLEVFCPGLGQACLALFEDEVWYRAQIIGLPGGQLVEVMYVDFGNKRTLPVSDIRKIKEELLALPAMAIQCCLAEVEPPGNTGSWSKECKQRFCSLVGQKLVSVMATDVPRQKAMPVRLLTVGEGCEQPTNIGELLVKEELALKKGVRHEEVKDVTLEEVVWDPPFEGLLEGEVCDSPIKDDLEQEDGLDLQLPTKLKDLRVRVTHVSSPGSFFVQLLQVDNQLKRVGAMLKEEYAKSPAVEVEWGAEMYCAAFLDGVWERGVVCSVSPSGIAEVRRCDFGNKVNLHVNNLRPLSPHLIGQLALECSLSGIRPAGGCSTWTATSCDFISYFLTGAAAAMTVKENTSEWPVPVALYCSNRMGQDVSVADFLVSEGLALKERPPNVISAPSATGADQKAPLRTWAGLASDPEKVATKPYAPPELPPCGRTRMTVTAIGEDGVIYAVTRRAERQFEKLKETVQLHIKSLPRQKSFSWKSVLGCAVMGSDMLWYRGEVLEVIGGHVKVRYVDHGLVENLPVCHVYPIMLCEEVPQLCVPCRLHGVIPVGGAWQWDAVNLLRELLLTRCVDLQVTELPVDPRGPLTIEIMLDGMTLSRIMVHHQHATFDPAVTTQEDYVTAAPAPALDHWYLDTTGLEDTRPILGTYAYPKVPEGGERFPVRIKHLCTPNEVFLCPLVELDGCVEESGESLEEALTLVNSELDSLPLLRDFPIEGPCLAEYSDGKYYRAKVLGVETFNPVQVLVRHVDFGSDDTVPTEKLRQIPSELLRFPCKAVKARVAGLKPPKVNLETERVSYQPEWSMKAVLEMIDLLHGDISASVVSIKPDLTVLLYNEKGALVHLPLVEKGLAELE